MNEMTPLEKLKQEDIERKGTRLSGCYLRVGDGEVKVVTSESIAPESVSSVSAKPEGGAPPTSTKPEGRVKCAAKMVAGGVCVAAGIPMLILPGPGLLAIGGGAALIASGAKGFIKKRG